MDHVILWEAPPIIKPEFRLYYDAKGHVVCYTCDTSLKGDFVVIDAATFAEGRPDIRVVDGKISTGSSALLVSKLVKAKTGIRCAAADMSIVVEKKYKGKTNKWELKTYEL